MFPAPNTHTFLGVMIQQAWSDLQVWESFFNTHKIGTLVELGTGGGGMSLFLSLQCKQRGIGFTTFDQWKWLDFGLPVTAMLGLERQYKQANVWDEGALMVNTLLGNHARAPMLLFCDDGDKPREVALFGPMLNKGDFLAVHDWDVEIQADHIDTARYAMLDTPGATMTRWFTVK